MKFIMKYVQLYITWHLCRLEKTCMINVHDILSAFLIYLHKISQNLSTIILKV